MSWVVVIAVRFHEGRYHGMGDGPPSPARLFQALVAAAGLNGTLGAEEEALMWLEARHPPAIGSPPMISGQSIKNYLPNNDFDAVGGDVRRVATIRTNKIIRPLLFDARIPFLYVWDFDDHASEQHAAGVCALAERLYQLGRGVDQAWATAEILEVEQLDTQLSTYEGLIYRPSGSGSGRTLSCPQPGSLKSLKDRYDAGGRRFGLKKRGRSLKQLVSQPPKPRFAQVAYESPPFRQVYELRGALRETALVPWPLARASRFVVALRNGAVERLRDALPAMSPEIERFLVGRKADGADDGPTALRVRIVPLASIGHPHADQAIRRVLVEVPAGCPLRADDVHWAFSGLEPVDPETQASMALVVTPSSDEKMLGNYGVGGGRRSRIWRTVTPAALPAIAKRRRISPTRVTEQAKSGPERGVEQARAAATVLQALRHADVRTHADAIRVQREPFHSRGERVEAFAQETRFAKERLWHVEITFEAPVGGTVVIGDGRFLGLGVMAPQRRVQGIHAFAVTTGLLPAGEPQAIARALRRAVMARVQESLGSRRVLPPFFAAMNRTGRSHERNHSRI